MKLKENELAVENSYHSNDISRLVEMLEEITKEKIPRWFAESLWEQVSAETCAGWLVIPTDTPTLKRYVSEYMEV